MTNTGAIRARIVAVLLGMALLLLGATVPSRLFGGSLLSLFLFDIVTYTVTAVVLGFLWPSSGWRLGLYLVAVWPPLFLIGLFLSWEEPAKLSMSLTNLLGYLLVVVGACVGTGFGALLSHRSNANVKRDGFSSR